MATPYSIIKEEKKEGSQVELLIEVNHEEVAKERDAAIRELSESVEVKGFRKGKAPQEIAVKEIGEERIFERSAYRIINDTYMSILEKETYAVITHPEITVTKIAPGNPLEFKLLLTVAPEISLPDYRKIAQNVSKETSLELTETELEDHIKRILEQHARVLRQTKHTHDHSDGTCKDCETEKEDAEKEDASLPELTDELVKKFGEFENVADFKAKLKVSLAEEKKNQAQQKRRTEIIEGIISETKVDVPQVLVEAELDRMIAQLESDVTRMGLSKDQYFQAIQKTESDIRAEWKNDATKRAVMNVILPEIAKKENVIPEKEDIEKEVSHIKAHHMKDMKIDDLQLRVYVASVMTNEKVFEYLETL